MKAVVVIFPALLLCFAAGTMRAQAPTTPGPAFEVVSIKRNTSDRPAGIGANQERPDGGLTFVRVPATTLVARAWFPAGQPLMEGFPDWARREYFDVSATASLSNPTREDRAAMLRAMLADRFQLLAHFEDRPQEVFELRLSRDDQRLGRGLTRTTTDCAAVVAAGGGSVPLPARGLPDFTAPPPPCTLRVVQGRLRGDPAGGDRAEGESTMEGFAAMLRPYSGRPVVDRTGLAGYFRIDMTFDADATLGRGNPATPSNAPALFTALPEQLGLKLEAAQASVRTLVIDRLERPIEN